MITWTDIFEGIGRFSYSVFGFMKSLGHGPNFFISLFIIGILTSWTLHFLIYKNHG